MKLDGLRIPVRSEGVILAGAYWCLIGWGAWSPGRSLDNPGAWHLLLPPEWGSGIWFVTGGAAVVTGVMSIWPNLKDRTTLGLQLLMIGPIIRFSSWLWSWFLYLVYGSTSGDHLGWFWAAIYAGLILLVVLLAHIPQSVTNPLIGRRRC